MAFARNLEGSVLHTTDALHLSSLFSNASALFCAMEPSQPLSHQSLAHSFPCNRGRGYLEKNPPTVFRILCQVPFALSPFLATHPKDRYLSPLFATLPKMRPRKSFVCHTYDTPWVLFTNQRPSYPWEAGTQSRRNRKGRGTRSNAPSGTRPKLLNRFSEDDAGCQLFTLIVAGLARWNVRGVSGRSFISRFAVTSATVVPAAAPTGPPMAAPVAPPARAPIKTPPPAPPPIHSRWCFKWPRPSSWDEKV